MISIRAPIDPNFTGVGRCLTDDEGCYRFTTIKPGPYPWKNHRNAWRPAHIHFSLFGTEFTQRMITQMYFPGDPLFALDPIYQSITDQKARDRLVASYDHDVTTHEWATGYRWDIVLTGAARTPIENPDRSRTLMSTLLTATPGQTVGPFFGYALPFDRGNELVPPGSPGAIQLHGVVTDGDGKPVPDALLEIWQADADGVDPDVHRFASPRRLDLHRLGPRQHRRRRALQLLHGASRCDATGFGAPFILVTVFARGLLNRLFTRAYLPGEQLAGDPLLNSLPAERRHTLIAARDEAGLRFDITLQGASGNETVFLRYPGHRP